MIRYLITKVNKKYFKGFLAFLACNSYPSWTAVNFSQDPFFESIVCLYKTGMKVCCILLYVQEVLQRLARGAIITKNSFKLTVVKKKKKNWFNLLSWLLSSYIKTQSLELTKFSAGHTGTAINVHLYKREAIILVPPEK